MGASLTGRTYNSIEDARSRWDDAVEESEYEDGSSYSGEIGMLGRGFSVCSHIANSSNEAYDYLGDQHSKWDGAMGVRFYMKGGIAKSSANKKEKLDSKLSDAQSNLDSIKRKISHSFFGRKAQLITCAKCHSKVNKGYINKSSISCPVCEDSLISKTDLSRLQKSIAKVRTIENEVRNFKPTKTSSGKSIGIVVGGWCSS